MLTYFIYLIVFVILLFVIIIAAKAISRGIEAKQDNKATSTKKINENSLDFDQKAKILNLVDDINKLNELHYDGKLSYEEFKKAKEKIQK